MLRYYMLYRLKYVPVSIICVLTTFLLAAGIFAYPSSILYIPTATTLDEDELLVEVGSFGYSQIMNSESTEGLMLQFGLTSNLEMGADVYSTSGEHDSYWNIKANLLPENSKNPALAVGVMDVTSGERSSVYAVGTKTIGPVRAHLGLLNSSYSHGVMAGLDMDAGDKTWFGVDYLPGDENYIRFGAARCFKSDTWVTLSYGLPNGGDSENEVSLTISSYLPLKGPR